MEPCHGISAPSVALLQGWPGAEIDLLLNYGVDAAFAFQYAIDSVYQDITGYAIAAEIWKYKQDVGDVTKTPLLTFEAELNDPVYGKFIISLQETLINTLAYGPCIEHPDSVYFWRLRLLAPAIAPANPVSTRLAFGKVFVQI